MAQACASRENPGITTIPTSRVSAGEREVMEASDMGNSLTNHGDPPPFYARKVPEIRDDLPVKATQEMDGPATSDGSSGNRY
ncbi:hypothetical protein HCU01_20590 [Halomonas cupida]|uniref:Uncharacterized protein n=1 Tax=Halomonas cupida TaxID=44933 RepID=A0ABQ0WEL7_9GAMM|nr:hypothetical protein HCU01_20590 [Halomonas cupida]